MCTCDDGGVDVKMAAKFCDVIYVYDTLQRKLKSLVCKKTNFKFVCGNNTF